MDQGSTGRSLQGAPIRCVRLKVQLHFLLSHVGEWQAGTAGSAQLLVLSYGLPRLTAGLSFWGLAAGGGGQGAGLGREGRGLGAEKSRRERGC
jgi:hypothetical protein